MATFSENQVRQLYVVNGAADFTPGKDKDGILFFGLKDVDGKPVRSDLLTHIMSAKATSALAMQRKLRTIKLTAADADMVAGQDYIVKINYRKFISQSDEDTYQEIASAHCATTGDEVEVVLRALAENLVQNTRKQELIHVTVVVGGVEKEVAALGTSDVVTDIIIREIAQPWTLGVKQEEAVDFTVSASPITKNSEDYAWATISDETANETTVLGNGKKIADLEYFCLGERGDIYRNMGWPNVIPTKYMVDPAKQYDCIDIHYAYVGSNHAVQKSEKDITLVMPAGTPAAPDHTVASAVLDAINNLGIISIEIPTDWDVEE